MESLGEKFFEDTSGKTSSEKIIEERGKKVVGYLKKKSTWIFYIILVAILGLSYYLRTLNMSKLKDVSTGTWTLGPDLDPFLFLRWAQEIVEHGKLGLVDTMRNVPLGFNTAGEMKLFAYLIAWFHYALSFLGLSDSVTYSAILFPVAAALFTAFAFFLFTRKIFYREDEKTRNIIALIATAFLVVMPSWLPRSIAGIPEKESIGFGFMFMALYFFICAFTDKDFKKRLIWGVCAGVFTALMGLVWGGVVFIFYTAGVAFIIYYFYGQVKKEELGIYASWIFVSLFFLHLLSTRYPFKILITSTDTGFALASFVLVFVSFFLSKNNKIRKYSEKKKIPLEVCAFFSSFLVVAFVGLMVMGWRFYLEQINWLVGNLVKPSSANRFQMTVAENKQPFYSPDWKGSFGPSINNLRNIWGKSNWNSFIFDIPFYFGLFMIGAVWMIYDLEREISTKKRSKIIAGLFALFLFTFIFSRTSADSILNGTSGISLIMYALGFLLFVAYIGYSYFLDKRENCSIYKINKAYIIYLVLFILSLIGARGGVRLIMFLGVTSPILVSFLIVKASRKASGIRDETLKMFWTGIVIIIMIISLLSFYYNFTIIKNTAENFAPSSYNQQWQKAMFWVRENTQENAVFAHWWDYGYWVQSVGERATVLDGGNAIGYWNHLMGRHVLTTPDRNDALEFMYAHNVTHLLIDSTDIGKYTAFSSIGSDENYDRFSWIQTFLLDSQQSYVQDEVTYNVYSGGFALDEDIVWNENGIEIFLPAKKSGIFGVIVPSKSQQEYGQPIAVIVYNGKQYKIPLKYLYIDGQVVTFNQGIHAGAFVYPRLDVESGQGNVNREGALLYLSPRTIDSTIARLYLFGEDSEGYRLAHVEGSEIVNGVKSQSDLVGDFLYYQGFQGPIKIWEISYPHDITYHPEYIERDYPDKSLSEAKPGQYN